jgi:hypothetical protein
LQGNGIVRAHIAAGLIYKLILNDIIGLPKKRWMKCVKDDMIIKGVNMEITIEKYGRRKHVMPPHLVG